MASSVASVSGSGSRKSPNSADVGEAAERTGVRLRRPGAREERGEPLGRVPRQDRVALAEEADALAGGGEKLGEREEEDLRPIALGGGREPRAEIHRGREVGPEPHHMGRLPFLLADVEMLVAGRAPPVDRGRGLARREGAELPEGLAAAGDAAAMPAGNDGRRDAAGLDQKVGQAAGDALRLGQRSADRAGLALQAGLA